MNIRIVAVGQKAETTTQDAVRHLRALELDDRIIEKVRVLKLTTAPYCKLYNRLEQMAKEHLARHPHGRQCLRRTLGHIFYGLEGSLDERLADVKDQKAMADEKLSRAIIGFQKCFRSLAKEQKLQFTLAIQEFVKQHQEELQTNDELFGKSSLIVPDIPLVETKACYPRNAGVGTKYANRIMRDEKKRQELLRGLGVTNDPRGEQGVDVVVIVFSMNDAFGGEGARIICNHIRETLEDPDANRIVATVGFGLYDESSNAHIDGRYFGSHMKIDEDRRDKFDGLLTHPHNKEAGQRLADVLMMYGLSADRESKHIDNPDSNQIQRDCAMSTSAVGVAKVEGSFRSLVELYQRAKQDCFRSHDLKELSFMPTLRTQVAELQQAYPDWECPRWLAKLTSKERAFGDMLQETARKLIIYVGHNNEVPGPQFYELRRLIQSDFPRARTVIYKYSLSNEKSPLIKENLLESEGDAETKAAQEPPEETTAKTQAPEKEADKQATPVKKKRKARRKEKEKDPKEDKVGPHHVPTHLGIFVVDSFEPVAAERITKWLEEHVTIKDAIAQDGASNAYKETVSRTGQAVYEFESHSIHEPRTTLYPDQSTTKAKARNLKHTMIARALISKPGIDSMWGPDFFARDLRTASCADGSVQGGLDEQFCKKFQMVASCLVGEGESSPENVLLQETSAASETVRTVQSTLKQEALNSHKTSEWIANVLAGLNWVCNETIPRRKVQRSVACFLEDIHHPNEH